jgi:PilZ domain
MQQARNSPAHLQPGSHQKERKYRRFDLQFPVCLSFPSGGVVRELDAISENVSIGGLLLKAGDQVPPRTPVSLTMDVQGPWSHRPVRLVARGEVVRVEPLESGGGFAIAIECRQPMTAMKGHLPAAS